MQEVQKLPTICITVLVWVKFEDILIAIAILSPATGEVSADDDHC